MNLHGLPDEPEEGLVEGAEHPEGEHLHLPFPGGVVLPEVFGEGVGLVPGLDAGGKSAF